MAGNDEVVKLMASIRKMRVRFSSYFTRILGKEKISLQQYTMLFTLASNEKMKMKTMATHLGVTNPAVTHFVDTLEKRQLVKRVPSESDRRVIFLDITENGRSFIEGMEEKCHRVVSKSFLAFDEATRNNIHSFYDTIINNFDEELRDESH